MSLTPDQHDTLIDRIVELFQSNEASIDFGANPDQWVAEHLPEGTEAADVASCMPEVGERLGGPYQQNLGHYTAHSAPVTHSVINEISYTYNTVYQQNAFIYAEEGAQVTNIQGDGNTVTQVQIDDSFDAEHPDGWDDYEPELPEEVPVDEDGNPYEPEDGYEGEPEDGEDGEDGYEETEPEDGYEGEDGGYEDPTMGEEMDGGMDDGGYEDGGMDDGGMDAGMEPAAEPPADDMGGME
jgi:hypothetical protein